MSARMPDFKQPTRCTRHDLGSALASLAALGFSPDDVAIEMAGKGWASGHVVDQDPQAGDEIGPGSHLRITVAGEGALHSLPFALRVVDLKCMGVEAVLAPVDAPIQRLHHHIRCGGRFFSLDVREPRTAVRWLEMVFQVGARDWSAPRRHHVVRLLSRLDELAGSTRGIVVAMRLLFDLPVSSLQTVEATIPVSRHDQWSLGRANSALGISTLLGVGRREIAGLDVQFGPVSLEQYRMFNRAGERAERQAAYDLLLPAQFTNTVSERWTVGDPLAGVRLTQDVVLGVNTYLN